MLKRVGSLIRENMVCDIYIISMGMGSCHTLDIYICLWMHNHHLVASPIG